jgi:hypothetical protein
MIFYPKEHWSDCRIFGEFLIAYNDIGKCQYISHDRVIR